MFVGIVCVWCVQGSSCGVGCMSGGHLACSVCEWHYVGLFVESLLLGACQLTGFRKVLSVLEQNLTSGNKSLTIYCTESKIHLFFIKSLENFRTFLSICETLKNDVFP